MNYKDNFRFLWSLLLANLCTSRIQTVKYANNTPEKMILSTNSQT